jgi:hypothetical protein
MAARFIEIRDSQQTSSQELAEVVESTGARLALVIEGTEPAALVEADKLIAADAPSVAHRIGDEVSLTETSVRVELSAGGSTDLHVYYQEGYIVVLKGEKPFILRTDQPLRSVEDLQTVLGRATLQLFAADATLPGPPDPLPDPMETYHCEQGHTIRQRASDPNRRCPIDGSGLSQ